MLKWFCENGRWTPALPGRTARAGVYFVAALCLSAPGQAQTRDPGLPGFTEAARTTEPTSGAAGAQASQLPAFTISVEPLGFSRPGSAFLGQNISFASLDFLDENRLLFTFRIPGLMRRPESADAEGKAAENDERHIRALVLKLPSGAVEAEAVWAMHGPGRYLWMLKDKHFLLRDGAELKQGNEGLELKPALRFPGPLESVEMDPSQELLVAGTREPAAEKAAEGSQTELVLRILHRDSGQVMLSSRLKAAIRLPINGNGYLESLRARGIEWQLNEHAFSGGVTPVARLLSTCAPTSTFVSQQELVAVVCTTLGDHKLQALTTGGRVLWEVLLSDHEVWPLLVMAQNGARLALESLLTAHPANASASLTTEDLKGQVVRVYDAANGHLALSAEVNPPLDAGGNVAISPSGRRVAVLNGEVLEIFDLGLPPGIPEAGSFQNGH